MQVEFTGDELILALMSLVRAVNPAMLRQTSDGFTVDFESLERKQPLTSDEQLLLRLRDALEHPSQDGTHALELSEIERARLAETLTALESLQPWPPDVMAMSQTLRARLVAVK